MTETPSQEQLVAYVDGELDAAETQRLERLLEGDAELREDVRRLRESTALLRAAYQGSLSAPLPDDVLEAFARAAPRLGRPGSGPWWPAAMAAAAAVVLALPLGFAVSDYRWGQRLEHQAEIARADQEARLAALESSLERQVSGKSVEWHNPDSGALGEVTPVRTFKSAAGQWCREYESRTERAGASQVERGIACRDDAGEWQRRIVLVEDS